MVSDQLFKRHLLFANARNFLLVKELTSSSAKGLPPFFPLAIRTFPIPVPTPFPYAVPAIQLLAGTVLTFLGFQEDLLADLTLDMSWFCCSILICYLFQKLPAISLSYDQ